MTKTILMTLTLLAFGCTGENVEPDPSGLSVGCDDHDDSPGDDVPPRPALDGSPGGDCTEMVCTDHSGDGFYDECVCADGSQPATDLGVAPANPDPYDPS